MRNFLVDEQSSCFCERLELKCSGELPPCRGEPVESETVLGDVRGLERGSARRTQSRVRTIGSVSRGHQRRRESDQQQKQQRQGS
jgi:hypothetical protein